MKFLILGGANERTILVGSIVRSGSKAHGISQNINLSDEDINQVDGIILVKSNEEPENKFRIFLDAEKVMLNVNAMVEVILEIRQVLDLIEVESQ